MAILGKSSSLAPATENNRPIPFAVVELAELQVDSSCRSATHFDSQLRSNSVLSNHECPESLTSVVV